MDFELSQSENFGIKLTVVVEILEVDIFYERIPLGLLSFIRDSIEIKLITKYVCGCGVGGVLFKEIT